MANATMTLVRTSSSVFGVTNEHVLQIYRKHRRAYSNLFCQLGSTPFEPLPSLIDQSEAWDLATFRLPNGIFTKTGGNRRPCDCRIWPRAEGVANERIIAGGYPEKDRSTSGGRFPKTLHLDFAWFSKIPENRSDSHVSFRLGSEDWHWTGHGRSLEPQPDLSGVSGGPCFRVIVAEDHVDLQLAGFIYEAGRESEIVRIRHVALISEDGTIAAPPFGWKSKRAP